MPFEVMRAVERVMPAMGLDSVAGIVISDIVGAASAANVSGFYSRLKLLPQCCCFSLGGHCCEGLPCREVA